MFLSYEHWSPRYDDTFFTIKMDSTELFHSKPPPKTTSTSSRNSLPEAESAEQNVVSNEEEQCGGNTNFPAYYYKIEVYCSRQPSYVIYRRYSQFHWLYKQLQMLETSTSQSSSGDHNNSQQQQPEQKLVFPPGTCFWYKQNDTFAQNRLVQLYEFMKDTLQIQTCANHPSVIQFLELSQQ